MLNKGIFLSSLGGSGENGRNCHLIGTGDGLILLDCGVKREICGDTVGFYPNLTKEIAADIKAVFLSHCHEDHVAALPLLYELGYTGMVYASAETLAEVPGFIKKWMSYVEAHNGLLPYKKESVEKIRFVRLGLGEQEIDGIHMVTGRSGHVLGGIWYTFFLEGKTVFYSGDMSLNPAVLAIDLPGPCDGAIVNSAYAGKSMDQEAQYDRLLESIKETISQGGKVLLPVPSKGRGIDILIYLEEHLPGVPLYVEQAIVDSRLKLSQEKDWIQTGMVGTPGPAVTVIDEGGRRREALSDDKGAVYLTPDGMLTTPVSLEYYDYLKGDPRNKIIITGHAAMGTVGYGVLDKACREEQGVLALGEKIVFKVHLDDDDVVSLCKTVKARKIVLFHSEEAAAGILAGRLETMGVMARTLQYPDVLEL